MEYFSSSNCRVDFASSARAAENRTSWKERDCCEFICGAPKKPSKVMGYNRIETKLQSYPKNKSKWLALRTKRALYH